MISPPATFYLTTDYRIQPDVRIDQIEYCESVRPLPYFCLGQMKAHRFTTPKRKSRLMKNVKANPGKYLDDGFVRNIFDQCEVDLIETNSDVIDQKMDWEDVTLFPKTIVAIGGPHSHNSLAFWRMKK